MKFYCFYCVRIYDARYKIQFKITIGGMETFLGKSQERMSLFLHYLQEGIAFMQAQGTASARVPWIKFEQQHQQAELFINSTQEVAMDEPEDNWMYFSDYTKIHGDPQTNGLGHTRTCVNKKDIVIIPGPKVGKLRRSHKIAAELKTKIASEADSLGGGILVC